LGISSPPPEQLNQSNNTVDENLSDYGSLLSELEGHGFSTDMILNNSAEDLIRVLEERILSEGTVPAVSEKELLRAELAQLEAEFGDIDLGEIDEDVEGYKQGSSLSEGRNTAELEARLAFLEKQLLDQGFDEF